MKKQLFLILLFLIPGFGFAETFSAGTDYVVIAKNKKDATNKETVKVTEFFSYGCPWCYRIEAKLQTWVTQRGKNITFNKIPVVFNKDWEYYAKAYYTAEALSLVKQLSPALFTAIITERRQLNSNQAMIDFFTSHGADPILVKSAFLQSPSIDVEINQSKNKMVKYQVNAIPAFLVNNQFKTDLQMAKNETRLFAILDFLVKKSTEKKEGSEVK